MKRKRDLTRADRILKVNHAGEHGAINIYRGQRIACFWRDAELKRELEEFRAHEERHRAIFAAELQRRGVRRCRSYAACGAGGLLLGLATGICGRASIAAVAAIVDDERAHHDRAAQESRTGIFWPRLIRPTVRWTTELVIWTGMKL